MTRPTRFDEVVGQEGAVTLLLKTARKPLPAYLLVGPPSTGKTSCARLFARAILGEEKETFNLIDVNCGRGLEAVRYVRDLVAHVSDRRVIILEEAQQLTGAGFTQLLGPLEDSPKTHFILTTTNIDGIPAAVQSRCLRVNFLPIPARVIFDYMKSMTTTLDATTLKRIALDAKGSMRDALIALEGTEVLAT